MSPADRRLVFSYLIDKQELSDSSLMNLQNFMRIKEEAKERNIDAKELQAFQEHLSAKAPQYEKMDIEEKEKRELELVS